MASISPSTGFVGRPLCSGCHSAAVFASSALWPASLTKISRAGKNSFHVLRRVLLLRCLRLVQGGAAGHAQLSTFKRVVLLLKGLVGKQGLFFPRFSPKKCPLRGSCDDGIGVVERGCNRSCTVQEVCFMECILGLNKPLDARCSSFLSKNSRSDFQHVRSCHRQLERWWKQSWTLVTYASTPLDRVHGRSRLILAPSAGQVVTVSTADRQHTWVWMQHHLQYDQIARGSSPPSRNSVSFVGAEFVCRR